MSCGVGASPTRRLHIYVGEVPTPQKSYRFAYIMFRMPIQYVQKR